MWRRVGRPRARFAATRDRIKGGLDESQARLQGGLARMVVWDVVRLAFPHCAMASIKPRALGRARCCGFGKGDSSSWHPERLLVPCNRRQIATEQQPPGSHRRSSTLLDSSCAREKRPVSANLTQYRSRLLFKLMLVRFRRHGV